MSKGLHIKFRINKDAIQIVEISDKLKKILVPKKNFITKHIYQEYRFRNNSNVRLMTLYNSYAFLHYCSMTYKTICLPCDEKDFYKILYFDDTLTNREIKGFVKNIPCEDKVYCINIINIKRSRWKWIWK